MKSFCEIPRHEWPDRPPTRKRKCSGQCKLWLLTSSSLGKERKQFVFSGCFQSRSPDPGNFGRNMQAPPTTRQHISLPTTQMFRSMGIRLRRLGPKLDQAITPPKKNSIFLCRAERHHKKIQIIEAKQNFSVDHPPWYEFVRPVQSMIDCGSFIRALQFPLSWFSE